MSTCYLQQLYKFIVQWKQVWKNKMEEHAWNLIQPKKKSKDRYISTTQAPTTFKTSISNLIK